MIKWRSGNRKEYGYPMMKDGGILIMKGKDKTELLARNFVILLIMRKRDREREQKQEMEKHCRMQRSMEIQ